MPAPEAYDDRDRRLGEAIDAYLEAMRHGAPPAQDEVARRFPDVADELRECLAAIPFLGVALNADLPRATAAVGGGDDSTGSPRAPPGYTLLEEIGRGGMGVVYRALQHSTRRVVALKYLVGGPCASESLRKRFEREVELAASLDHPGIVRILDSGEHEGWAYCAMEHVDGRPLHVWLKQDAPALKERLVLFLQVADAIQYAHHRAVIHRDLKPSNVMIDGQGRARILDFGLARLDVPGASATESLAHLTRADQFLGTLPYLSPEQASGGAAQAEIRSDLYSLGVILYEMVAERPPYETGGSLADALRNICTLVPPRPSLFCRQAGRDLDAIVLKALEKSKADRYQTADALAEDLRCYLRGEPVEANRTSRFFLLRKAYARHRTQVHLAAAALTVVLGASAAILALYVEVRRERNRLAEELHVSRLQRGLAHLAAGHDRLAEDLLWPAYRTRPDAAARWSLLSYYIHNPLAVFVPNSGWILCAGFSPDGRRIAYGDLAGRFVVVEAPSGRRVVAQEAHPGGVSALAFAPGGNAVVTGGADGHLRLWRDDRSQFDEPVSAHSGRVIRLRFRRIHDELISAGADGRVRLWSVRPRLRPGGDLYQGRAPLSALDVSVPRNLLAAAGPDHRVRLIEMGDGSEQARLDGFERPVEAVAFSPDGQTLAVWSDARLSLWEVDGRRKRWTDDAGLTEPRPTSLWDFPPDAIDRPPTPHVCWIPPLAFSPDGRYLAAGDWGAKVRLWDVVDGRRAGELRAHGTAVYTVAFAPGSLRLLAGCAGTIRVWDLSHSVITSRWPVQPARARTIAALSGAGDVLAWGGEPGDEVHVVTVGRSAGPRTWSTASSVQALAVDRAGRTLATADETGRATLWDVQTGGPLRSWQAGTGRVRALAFAPEGGRLACGDEDGRIALWRCSDAGALASWQAHGGIVLALEFSPDGTRLISGGADWHARVWSTDAAPRLLNDWTHGEWVNAVAFSPDGERFATGGADLRVRIGPVLGQPMGVTAGVHAHWVNGLAFLDGGRVLVSGSNDESLRFWDATDGTDLSRLRGPGGPIHTLAASADGCRLVVGAAEAVQVIDLRAAAELIERQGRAVLPPER